MTPKEAWHIIRELIIRPPAERKPLNFSERTAMKVMDSQFGDGGFDWRQSYLDALDCEFPNGIYVVNGVEVSKEGFEAAIREAWEKARPQADPSVIVEANS